MSDQAVLPEVTAFLAARDELDTFTRAHPDIIREYRRRAEDLDQKRQDADHVCRAKGISCGPWRIKNRATRYRADRIREVLGPKAFKAIGGKTETVAVHSIAKEHVEDAIKTGKISRAILKDIRTITPNYKSPKPGRLP